MEFAQVRNYRQEHKIYLLDKEMGLTDEEDEKRLDEYYEYLEQEKLDSYIEKRFGGCYGK